MKNRLFMVLTACFAVIAVLFGALWVSERNSKDDARLLAQASAADACERFRKFEATGEAGEYWFGVAGFRSFEQAYKMLVDGTNKKTNYTFCNEVYASLVLSPEKSREHISEICEVMELLSKDVEDINGYARMADLRNALRE